MENQVYQLFVDNEFYFIIAADQNEMMDFACKYQCFAESFDEVKYGTVDSDSELKITDEDTGITRTVKEIFQSGETGVICSSIN